MSTCQRYTSCYDCLFARDPFCGWDGRVCVEISSRTQRWENKVTNVQTDTLCFAKKHNEFRKRGSQRFSLGRHLVIWPWHRYFLICLYTSSTVPPLYFTLFPPLNCFSVFLQKPKKKTKQIWGKNIRCNEPVNRDWQFLHRTCFTLPFWLSFISSLWPNSNLRT